MSPDFNPRLRFERGLGLDLTSQTAAQTATAAATTAAGIYGSLVAVGSAAGPIGAAVGGAIALGVAIYNLVQGCGSTCTQASDIANQVEQLLLQNLNNYLSQPVRTTSMQQAGLTTFTSAWAQLQQLCGNPQLVQAGQNCISQRSATGCQWKTSPSGWVQNSDGTCTYTGAGPAGSGSTCWNWFVGYYDPILNDPCVVPDSALSSTTPSTSSTASSTASSTSGAVSAAPTTNYAPLILAGAVILGVVLLA